MIINALQKAYKGVTYLLAPVVPLYLNKRLQKGKEDPLRLQERYGKSSLSKRPVGKLIWIHAASVGESRSALALIHHLIDEKIADTVLVTTGTVTSAHIMSASLPVGAIHQYIPLDMPTWCDRFVDFWQPDVALWIEQEFWPNILESLFKRRIKTYLINGRFTEKSAYKWRSWRGAILRSMLQKFTKCYAQSEEDAKRLEEISGREVLQKGNLKYTVPCLDVEEKAYQELVEQIQGRPIWLAASTHPGEEEIALQAHKKVLKQYPNALLIMVPRHPNRRDEIIPVLQQESVIAVRSKTEKITKENQVYLADTLGELGVFYKLSSIVFMGGTFADKGGHNPIEAAQYNCAILYGPSCYNNGNIVEDFKEKMGPTL